MNKPVPEIKINYDLYQELLTQLKTIENKKLYLDAKSQGKAPRWLFHQCLVSHSTLKAGVIFQVQQHRLGKKYGILLRYPDLTNIPFFRFDSDGPAHTNHSEGLTMEERQIPTPHFNSYDSEGRPVAYKTEVLKKESEAKYIIEDINFGLSHYCYEANVYTVNGDFPEVGDKTPKLELNVDTAVDFFNGAQFE